MSGFPIVRPRRLRANPAIRDLVREVRVHPDSLVMPMFIRSGKNTRKAIASMPGIEQLSPDQAVRECEALLQVGVNAVLLFGLPEEKDAQGSSAYQEDGVVQQAIRAIKKEFPKLLVIADVCLCDYTDHGHCGVVRKVGESPDIDNDATLELLSKIAGSMARAGADIVAPSDMMDGRVQKIRDELDAAGFKEMPILSYAVKYASSFYGPFREALESAPQFGDRKSYQMDFGNLREAFREASQDVEEGADILMVKPALTSLDVLAELRRKFDIPLAAYQVSGEYAAIKFAARHDALDESAAVLETWTVLRRAGADIIVSYFARDFARFL
ncbi:MAG TPA: porphobilinogen synthase [Deltaproteobacteria bacterium]|nr:porphobilinogen synthase [Deltaproteobacteria bacterium]